MKKQILFCIALMLAVVVQAQVTITGVVTDTSKETLPGVSIMIKGKAVGTTTDFDGNYSIQASAQDVLEFTYVGMIKQAVTVGNRKVINIQMVPDAINLDEVVAIGYGISKKSDLTGAVASIKSENLSNSKIGTVTTALQGLAAGVHVSTGSVKPGGDASVVIRGVGSLRAGSEPLYIVDGVPVQGGLQDLSSVDIESIEILKDASSASIYGSRGSNGVVLVTTKKGSTGKAKISLNASFGTQRMLNKQELMNAQEYYDLVSLAQPNYKWTSEELRLLSRGESTDWQDAVTQNGQYQNYNLSIAGGKEDMQHYLGIDWYDQKGTIKNSDFNKLTVRYNMDSKLNDWFNYGVRFNIIESTLHNINEEADSGYGTMFSAISSQPTAPIYTDEGEYFDGFLNTRANPVAIVDLLDKATLKSRVVGSVYLEVEPIKNLKLRSDNGGELVFYKVNVYENGRMGQHYTEGGHASVMQNKKKYWQTENTATYLFDLNDDHKFTAMAGFSASKTTYEEATADSKKLSEILKYHNLGGAEEHGPNHSYAVPSALVSFYGRLNYNFSNRYLATFTMRADGSSRFAPGKRWGYFPSLAVAWRASEESFIKENVPAISNLKVRLSAGKLGNQNIGDFAYAARVSLGGSPSNYVFGNNLSTGSVQGSISNPDLTWEKANQLDLGIDFGLFNNRIAGTIEAYYKRTTDLLWEVPLPLESGFRTSLTNIGKIDNKGLEFTLNTVNIATKDFQWTTAFMISYNQNKIKELYDGKTDVNKWLFVGRPIDQYYMLKSEGIWQTNEANEAAKYNAQPGDRKIRDLKKDNVINGEDRDFCGVSTPKFYGSFTNTFSYKGFDLTAFFTFAGGHKINNSLNRYLNSFNVWGNMSKDYYKYYWRADQPNNKYPAPRVGSAYANGDGTDANLQRGDFLRLRNLELGYSLPKKLLKGVRASNIRLYFSMQNVFTATEFTGFDVESSDNTNPYPNSRSFIGGISLNF
ncbi:TonB-dependent receptor [Bacteroides sp. OttesenSCG-928-J23]|nr:TonB-dependent receptor [Bacteroides sp. OttesenSCG-928-N06]MDL2247308.1 TonB-dependent receptor [Bacteroides sp. OttesenSCG-928-J23]MDL2304850.1 TonB-dependent receptor [Bacteroides sp. OttesenSCG-928-D19]